MKMLNRYIKIVEKRKRSENEKRKSQTKASAATTTSTISIFQRFTANKGKGGASGRGAVGEWGKGGAACWTDIDRYIHEACVSVVNFILFDLILNEKAANDAGRISFIVILEPDRAADREREREGEEKREEEWHLIVRVRQPLHGHGHGHGHAVVGGGSRMAPTHETILLGVFTEHRIVRGEGVHGGIGVDW